MRSALRLLVASPEGHDVFLTSDDSSLVVLRRFEDVPGGNRLKILGKMGKVFGCLSFSSKCNDCETLVLGCSNEFPMPVVS